MIEPKLSTDDLRLAATLISEGLTMDEIAEKFDVVKGTLYSALYDNGYHVKELRNHVDGMRKMTISELRMIGLDDIPVEPTVVLIKRKPTHVLLTLDTYRALTHGT